MLLKHQKQHTKITATKKVCGNDHIVERGETSIPKPHFIHQASKTYIQQIVCILQTSQNTKNDNSLKQQKPLCYERVRGDVKERIDPTKAD